MLIGIIILFFGTSFTTSTIGKVDNTIINIEQTRFSPKDNIFDLKVQLLMMLGSMPSFTTCIIKNNSIAWSKAYGFSDIKSREKASSDTIYMTGSITKPFIATALLQLYEQGLFDIDDDVNDYLPFPLRNPKYPDINITFRMLLSHHSSINDHSLLRWWELNIYFKSFPVPEDPYPWLKDVLVPGGKYYSQKVWYNYPPGQEGNYSNVGFVLLGYLIEQLTNQSFEQYCQENILTPLQMQNTSFHPDTLDKDQLATPYVRILRFYIPLRHYDYNYVTAAGGIRSTLEDLSRFLLTHMNNGEYNGVRILEEETIELMHTIQYTNSRYGLGWIVNLDDDGRTREGHTGGAPGGAALMIISSSENFGVIFFINYYRDSYHPLEAFAWSNLKQMLFQKASKL
jgi:CubicO group peptidase (beta-lactamase class C family)